MAAKTRKRPQKRRPINSDRMVQVEPLTENQMKLFDAWDEGKHLFIYGCAGTGKTFCVIYGPCWLFEGDPPTPTFTSSGPCGDPWDWFPTWRPRRQVLPLSDSIQEHGEIHVRDVKWWWVWTLYGALKQQETIKFWSLHSFVVWLLTMLSSSSTKCKTWISTN